MSRVWLAFCLTLGAQEDIGAVRAALSASDFVTAWELAERQPNELQRLRARSEILYRAGDPSGALELARLGLSEHPLDLELLFRATGASIWLQEGALASHYVQRLSQAVEGVRGELGAEEASAWDEVARDFRARSEAVARHDEARLRAVARTRALSCAALAAVLGLIAWAARASYGRSSKPVS